MTEDERRAKALRKLKALQKRCEHPPGRHWQDANGYKCHMRRDFKTARTFHCDHCFALLPFGESLNPYVEQLAYDFLIGKFEHITGGFPSTAFHDGYRNYNERMESWRSAHNGDERQRQWFADQLEDYEAGAWAHHLETEGWPC
jgi:3',5'-cyclic AMP phosphodiesterase CpdA